MPLQQQISIAIKDELKRTFNPQRVNSATKAMGERAVQLNIERVLTGKDVNGKAFKKYSKPYSKYKAKVIDGKLKLKGKTKYAVKELPGYMRLTGQMLSDLKYRITQAGTFGTGNIRGSVTLYVAARSVKKAEGNIQRGRAWFGIARSGSTARYEQRELDYAFANKLGIGQKSTITIK